MEQFQFLLAPTRWPLLLLLAWTSSLPRTDAAGICFVQYLLADNNLESFIRKDLGEWIQSPAIRGEELTSWVYLDGRNLKDNNDRSVLKTPLPNVWTNDGSQLLTDASDDKHEESYYLRYDPNAQKMVVHTTLSEEQNSDDPTVLQTFLETALADCAQQSRTQVFVVFSSHGAGFAGFGGDYNKSGRKLRQYNANIAAALKAALQVVPEVDRYAVIGFDACLMQGLGVVDDYQNIAQYFLASEAVEPGHGWAYADLKATSSALELAQNIVDDYVSNPQGISHKTPKLLSLVDTQKYAAFLQSWDALCAAFLELLQAGTDGTFLAYLHRSRSQAIDFPSALDERGTKQQNSALDVGDFLTTFQALCNPKEGSTIATLLPQTLDAYNAMLETKGVGAGTKAGTGLHVTWPHRQAYNQHKDKMDDFLLESKEELYVDAPHYLEFLKAYLTVATASVTESVCATGAVVEGAGDEILLLDPTLQVVSESQVLVQADLKLETDMAIVEYGIDINTFVNSEERFRTRRRKKRRSLKDGTANKGFADHPPRQSNRYSRRRPRRRRRLQTDEDEESYFVLFGGDVQGNYSGPSYQARWNRRFFSLNQQVADAYETVFVYDDGEDGARSMPVLYFPPDTDVHQDGFVEFGTSWEEGEDELGGLYGFLTFSVDPQTQQPMDNLILFTASDNSPTSPIQETPRSARGSIAPIVFVDGYFEDEYYPVDTLVGGFNGTVFPWNETAELSLSTVTDVEYQKFFEADTIVVDIYAYDFDVEDEELEDWISFDVLTSSNKDDDVTKLDSPQVFESSAYSSSSPAMLSLAHFIGLATLVLLLGETQ